MKYFVLLVMIITQTLVPLFSQNTFSNLDLNSENSLLFTAEYQEKNGKKYNNLYVYNFDKEITQNISGLGESNPKLLTCYPENFYLLGNKKIIEIENRNGKARYSFNEKKLSWVELPQDLLNNSQSFIPTKDFLPELRSVSPNGNWYVYLEKKTPATAKLILKTFESDVQVVLQEHIDCTFETIPVLWSPDSSVLVYEKNEELYFLNIKNKATVQQIPEEYRRIGRGKIANLCWASEKDLVYISNQIVYLIPSNELFTRALYSDLVGIGRIIGRLPYTFNSRTDKFWSNAQGDALVLLKNKQVLEYIELSGIATLDAKSLFSCPFVPLSGTSYSFKVFWTPAEKTLIQKPYVWIEGIKNGKTESFVYTLSPKTETQSAFFEILPLPSFVYDVQQSPDGEKVAFLSNKGIHVYDIASWKQIAVSTTESIVRYAWKSAFEIVLGGNETFSVWNFAQNKKEILFLTNIQVYGWYVEQVKDAEKFSIVARSKDGNHFIYDAKNNVWSTTSKILNRRATKQNLQWRVFLDDSLNNSFTNAIFGRKLTAESSNIALFPETMKKTQNQQKKIALVFDAMESGAGVTKVLHVLNKYSIKATFFINGEFLRRFPNHVEQIVSENHQCASLFYTPYSLTASNYTMNESFIRRGLARNEDDFFELTGKELALFWHAPFYEKNDVIVLGGNLSGYELIEPSLVVPDTQTLEAAVKNNEPYFSSSQIIDSIGKKAQSGMIIPISLGLSEGTRIDYLYDNIELLITSLIRSGFDIVTVSELSR